MKPVSSSPHLLSNASLINPHKQNIFAADGRAQMGKFANPSLGLKTILIAKTTELSLEKLAIKMEKVST